MANRCDDRRTRAAAFKASLALAEVEPPSPIGGVQLLQDWPRVAARLGGGGKPGGPAEFLPKKLVFIPEICWIFS